MREDLRPINMSLCGPWNRAGVERWDVVDRSWCVYAGNSRELIEFLRSPMRDPDLMRLVMTGGPAESMAFWDELARRLHNQVASIASLIDHTRILMDYYRVDAADLVTQFSTRNETIRQMDQAVFLRQLRNYLLHRGHTPIISALSIGTSDDSHSTNHAFKVDAKAILTWNNWGAQARQYLSKFGERDGPVIVADVLAHARAMQDLYNWLFDQRRWVVALMPDRFQVSLQSDHEKDS